MTSEIAKLFVVIGAKTSEFEKGLAKTKAQMQQLGAVMTGVGVTITAALAAMTVSWAKAGDEVAKLSAKTGFSTEALSELRYAAQLSDSSLASLETGIKRMQATIIDARDGLSSATTALKDLNLSYKDLKDLAPEEQFITIVDALADIADPTLKAATAIAIFGRAGTDMLPMLDKGSAGLQEMRDEAHKLGLVFSAEAAQKAEDFNDSITRLKSAIGGLTANIGEALAPALTNIANSISSVISKVTDWARRHPELINVVSRLAGAIGILCAIIGPLLLLIPVLTKLLPLLGAAFHAALGPIGLITLAISGLIAVGTLLITNWDRIVAFFRGPAALATYDLKKKITDLSDSMVTGVKSAVGQVIADIRYEAQTEKSILDERQRYWKGKQYEKIDILDEVMLAEIKAIDPALGAQIEAINTEIRGIDAAKEARQRQADMDRAAAIRNQLTKRNLSKEERANLERELADIEDYWRRRDLIDQRNITLSEANIDDYYANKASAVEEAANTEIGHWQSVEQAFEDYHDQSLDYLKNTWLPQYVAIMEAAGMEIPKNIEEMIKSLTPAPLVYTKESPWLVNVTPTETLPSFGPVPLKDAGGLIEGPGLFAVGKGVKEIARAPSQAFSEAINLNIGTLIGDELSIRRLGRMLSQVLKEDGRRNSFPQVQQGYFTGTSGI